MKNNARPYEAAKTLYAPFDKPVDEDRATREALARVIAGTTRAGYNADITVNNKAEGSAPLLAIKPKRALRFGLIVVLPCPARHAVSPARTADRHPTPARAA